MFKILGEDKVMVEKLTPERLEAEFSLGPDAPQVITPPPSSVGVYPYLFHFGGRVHAARDCSLGANRGWRLSSA
jgi:hypothetical protein